MTMTPIELVHKALARLREWVPASEVAEKTGLPLPVVRVAMRELAAADRARRGIAGRWGRRDVLSEHWMAKGSQELFLLDY
jgi:hypothetical protein